MANLFDYLNWRGDLDFKASPLNPVDNIIFSQLSYLTLDGIVPGFEDKEGISIELAMKIFNEKLIGSDGMKLTSIFKDDPKLIYVLGNSKRFGNCHLFGFVNHVDTNREIQFSALGVHTNDGGCFIAFRGTDSSIIGWKENFNMSFKEIIPSQIEAVAYLEKIASMIKGPLRIGGHSKGGNPAIYAASHCSKKIQKRITVIYSNDSPGFHDKVISSAGFAAIKDRIRSYVPQASVIGMVLKQGYDNTVIRSSQSGLLQHDLYSWDVTYNDLIHLNKSTIGSRFINKTLREWMENLDTERSEQFIEAMYHIFSSADFKSIYELEVSWFATASRIIKSLSHIDLPTRRLIRKILIELFRSAGRNIDTLLTNEK
ncbi:MAG: DUF2974 domain-containing protein [Treponema sp.]|nr:DUF2974 domain-containing protein [Treponema sp.]